jgi:hypothetical protein
MQTLTPQQINLLIEVLINYKISYYQSLAYNISEINETINLLRYFELTNEQNSTKTEIKRNNY